MKINLTTLPFDRVYGIYGDNEERYTDSNGKERTRLKKPWDKLVTRTMPTRLRALHPEAAASFAEIAEIVVVSDMLRSAESSLAAAITPGRNARMPGTSGHNFGFSIDIHVDATLFRLGMRGKTAKRDLDLWMEKHDFYCHRRDHKMDVSEAWHYNHLSIEHRDADGGIWSGAESTDGYLQLMIMSHYGPAMKLSPMEAQVALDKLGFYDGEIDGKFFSQSKNALIKFQRRWHLGDTGKLDVRSQRLLAFLTAERVECVEVPE